MSNKSPFKKICYGMLSCADLLYLAIPWMMMQVDALREYQSWTLAVDPIFLRLCVAAAPCIAALIIFINIVSLPYLKHSKLKLIINFLVLLLSLKILWSELIFRGSHFTEAFFVVGAICCELVFQLCTYALRLKGQKSSKKT